MSTTLGAGSIGRVACDPVEARIVAEAGLEPEALPRAIERAPRMRAIDDLMVAWWRGADHVLLSGRERPGPTGDPAVRAFVERTGRFVGHELGGALWALPPRPAPGPPKVFCLGLMKTGTSTLTEALELLGLRTLHWGGRQAHHDVLDAVAAGELAIGRLPARDAYSDISTLSDRFVLTDLQHPGSRFILTVRDVDAWVDSRRRHVERNRASQQIGRYAGRNTEVDEPAWRAMWHAHLDGVRAHFAGRSDLLEIDLTASPRWDELAAFLDRPAPDVAFPAANVGGRPGAWRYPSFVRPRAAEPDHGGTVEAECPMCGTVAERFEPSGPPADRPDCRCPTCGSLERHRAQWVFLNDRTDALRTDARILHIGSSPVRDRLELAGMRVDRVIARVPHRPAPKPVLGRLRGAPRVVDLAALDVPDGSYDLVVASHVLQMVADDRAALAQLARVVAPGGGVLLTVPMFGDETDDGPAADAADRVRRFGAVDHVRAYGNDGAFEARLREAGFAVTVEDVPSSIGAAEAARFRLGRPEPLHWAEPVVARPTR